MLPKLVATINKLMFLKMKNIVHIYIYIYKFSINYSNIINKSIATNPKSQDRLKRLLPDGSAAGLVVSKALIPQL